MHTWKLKVYASTILEKLYQVLKGMYDCVNQFSLVWIFAILSGSQFSLCNTKPHKMKTTNEIYDEHEPAKILFFQSVEYTLLLRVLISQHGLTRKFKNARTK